VVGHGELWTAQLLAAALQQRGADAAFMDTREVLVVIPTSDGSSVDLAEEASNERLDAWFREHGGHRVVVATGFIAKNIKCVRGRARGGGGRRRWRWRGAHARAGGLHPRACMPLCVP
jgi:aspartokinase